MKGRNNNTQKWAEQISSKGIKFFTRVCSGSQACWLYWGLARLIQQKYEAMPIRTFKWGRFLDAYTASYTNTETGDKICMYYHADEKRVYIIYLKSGEELSKKDILKEVKPTNQRFFRHNPYSNEGANLSNREAMIHDLIKAAERKSNYEMLGELTGVFCELNGDAYMTLID